MGFTNMAYCFIFKEVLFEIIVILPQRVCLFSRFLFFLYRVLCISISFGLQFESFNTPCFFVFLL